MHTELADVTWRAIGGGYERASVVLGPDDTAFNPASTKRPIYGPALVVYERDAMSLDAHVLGPYFLDPGYRAPFYLEPGEAVVRVTDRPGGAILLVRSERSEGPIDVYTKG